MGPFPFKLYLYYSNVKIACMNRLKLSLYIFIYINIIFVSSFINRENLHYNNFFLSGPSYFKSGLIMIQCVSGYNMVYTKYIYK